MVVTNNGLMSQQMKCKLDFFFLKKTFFSSRFFAHQHLVSQGCCIFVIYKVNSSFKIITDVLLTLRLLAFPATYTLLTISFSILCIQLINAIGVNQILWKEIIVLLFLILFLICFNNWIIDKMIVDSLGGPQPYIPVGLDDKLDVAETVTHHNPQKRARVLCSYDAADATELNLTGNEVRN